MKKFILAFIVSFLIFSLFAPYSVASDIKFPSAIGYVNDYAGVIDYTTRQNIKNIAVDLEKKNGCEMAVATVVTTNPLDPKSYAVELFKKWGIGKKEYDNGFLILFAKNERRIEIEVGYGLEDILTDGFCGRVLDENVIPRFKEKKYGEGLLAGAAVLSDKVSKDYVPIPAAKKSASGGKKAIKPYLWVLIVFVFVLLVISAIIPKFSKNAGVLIFNMFAGAIIGYLFAAIIGAIVGAIIGLFMGGDGKRGGYHGWGGWIGSAGSGGRSSGGGSFGGGFGGFSGGSSGGGGAGRSW